MFDQLIAIYIMSLRDFNAFNMLITAKQLPYMKLNEDDKIKYTGNYAKLISSKKTS
jgi:hypothetical protein